MLIQFVKISLIFLMIIFCFLENKRLKKYDKGEIFMGSILLLSMLTIQTIPISCLIINFALMILWLFITKYNFLSEKIKFLVKLKFFTFLNKHTNNKFWYYILPCIIFLISYTIGLLIDYWLVSLLVLFQVYVAFLSLCLLSILVYLITYLKYPIIALFKKRKIKDVYNDKKYQKQTNYIFYLLLPYLALMLI